MNVIDRHAVTRGATIGLLLFVPISALRVLIDHNVSDFEHSGWAPLFAIAIFVVYGVAGFVGANNRVEGTALRVTGDLVELATREGLSLFARRKGAIAPGAQASVFVRPEVASLARDANALPADQPRYRATVESLLFDGANSSALVREEVSRLEFHIALPQTGQFADLQAGESIAFGFDPQRALCFAA